MDVTLYTPRDPQSLYPDKWNGPAAYKSDIYPDMWNGPAAYKDYLYPDRYRPLTSHKAKMPAPGSSLALQPRSTNTMDVRTFNEEAFHARVRAIRERDEREGLPGTRHYETFEYTRQVSGANQEPLGKSRRNCHSHESSRPPLSSTKQSKAEPVSSYQINGHPIFIDLTSDDETPAPPVRPITPRQAPQAITNGTSPSQMEISHRPPNEVQTLVLPPADMEVPAIQPSDLKLHNPQTIRVLRKVVTKLHTSQESVESDKVALSKRWEADPAMQTVEITERLQVLNEHYRVIEEELEAALGVVEGLI